MAPPGTGETVNQQDGAPWPRGPVEVRVEPPAACRHGDLPALRLRAELGEPALRARSRQLDRQREGRPEAEDQRRDDEGSGERDGGAGITFPGAATGRDRYRGRPRDRPCHRRGVRRRGLRRRPRRAPPGRSGFACGVSESTRSRWLACLKGLSDRSRSLRGSKRTERFWGTVTLDRSRSASDRGPNSWPGRDA